MEIEGHGFIDGGFGYNNPSTVAYFEVTQMHNHGPDVIKLFLSIGTGQSDFQYGAGSRWTNFLMMLKALPKVVTNGESSHNFMASLKATYQVPYYRWNVLNELDNLRMDEWIPGSGENATQRKIERLTEQYLGDSNVRDELREVAKKLVDHRRERANTPRWFSHCSSGHRYKDTAHELRRHGKKRHGMTDVALDNLERSGKIQ